MTRFNLLNFPLLMFAVLLAVPPTTHAAESYDNCTGFITSIPAVISTQGTWCLKQDLATAITSGDAITISTNNVTLDCNNFKLGGLAAGAGTLANGVHAVDRVNATVRRCNIRGFESGIFLASTGIGGGHIVEDNRFDGNTRIGLEVDGDGSVVRRNLVFDTGGTTQAANAYGIYAADSVDVLDNTVSGVAATSGGNGFAVGIYTFGNLSGSISNNRVRDLLKDGSGAARGIFNENSDRIAITGNHVIGDGSVGSEGVECFDKDGRARDNIFNGFETPIATCSDDGGNVQVP